MKSMTYNTTHYTTWYMVIVFFASHITTRNVHDDNVYNNKYLRTNKSWSHGFSSFQFQTHLVIFSFWWYVNLLYTLFFLLKNANIHTPYTPATSRQVSNACHLTCCWCNNCILLLHRKLFVAFACLFLLII